MPEQYVDLIPKVSELNRKIYLALSKVYLKALKEQTPFKTGDTGGRWNIKIIGPFVFQFINDNGDIITALEFGTDPHIIKARRKKFLRFKKLRRKSTYKKIPGNIAFEKNGYIYAKMVRHPGFKARRFIERIFDDPVLKEKFQRELDKALNY